jgi:endonuclease III
MTKKKQKADSILKKLQELYPVLPVFLKASNDWEFLVAVMLSAQTTDKKVNEVTPKLFATYKILKEYVDADEEEFREQIRTIGLNKGKAKRILQTAKIIYTEFNSKIPNTMEDLISLPGVGRKTANVILGKIYNIQEGVTVDTHVLRLANKFGLSKGKTADKVEKDLIPLVDEKFRFFFSSALVLYGREYSPAHKKNDDSDPISCVLNKS